MTVLGEDSCPTFTSNIGEVFHVVVPGGEDICDHRHDVLEFAIVHIHESLTSEDTQKLVVEIS